MVKQITSNWISRCEEIRLDNIGRGFTAILATREMGEKWDYHDILSSYKTDVSNSELANRINQIIKMGDAKNYVCAGRKSNDWTNHTPRHKKWKTFKF